MVARRSSTIVADGFSCREQIAQGTDRHGLHLGQVIQMALRGADSSERAYPEHQAERLGPVVNGNFGHARWRRRPSPLLS